MKKKIRRRSSVQINMEDSYDLCVKILIYRIKKRFYMEVVVSRVFFFFFSKSIWCMEKCE